MTKLVVVDLDEVCAKFMKYMTDIYGDPVRWDTYKLSDMFPDHARKVYNTVDDPATYKDLLPVPGAVDGANMLHKYLGLELIYVTARPKAAEAVTLIWLDNKGFPNSDNLVVTSTHDEKVDLIKDMNPWSLIEDRGATVLRTVNYVKYPLLYDRPWNRGFNLPRVLDWQDIYYRLEKVVK